MKRFLLLFSLLCLAMVSQAVTTIKDGAKYRITCQRYDNGCVVLGEKHDAAAFLYYATNLEAVPEDAWWVLSVKGAGFTMKNAATGQYMVYKSGKLTNDTGQYTAKGIQLSNTADDNYAVWTLTETTTGMLIIENAGAPGQYFNLRTDGSYLLGTYSSASTDNGFFQLYDEQGNQVVNTGGTTGDEDALSGLSGVNKQGEYWERTGLAMPVVVTTNVNDPILYRIRNVRSGQFVYVPDNELTQSEENSTKFYFTACGSGVNVYTQDKKYVSTYYTYYNNGNTGLTLASGTTGENVWSFGFSETDENSGYTIAKKDNLPETNYYQSQYLYWNDYKLNEYRAVGLYNVDNGSTFVFYSSDKRHYNHLIEQGISFNGERPTEGFPAYVDSLRVNGKDLTYDSTAKQYYLSLSQQTRETGTLTAKVEVKWAKNDGKYELAIDGETPNAEGIIEIQNASGEKAYMMTILKDDKEVATVPLNMTFLPIVEIRVSTCNGKYYNKGTLRVTDPDIAGYDSTFVAKFRYRGASAQGYPKKSYAVKLIDSEGNSVDREYFGLRNDNNWILDAMYIDGACMRNRVSTDLWNDFATLPYHRRNGWEKKAKTGTRGRFVEVFLNGRYHGLYCMTEKMDRKQLRLKKSVDAKPATETTEAVGDTIHGSLYKSSQWSYEVFMGHDLGSTSYPGHSPRGYNNNLKQETWASYEIKYPDWEKQKIDWGPLWNAVNFVATTDDYVFDEEVKNYFDYPVVRDYFLFIELMLATDNHGKNMFFFNYDQKAQKCAKMIGITPWDLDGTWGIRWDGSKSYTKAAQNFTQFITQYEHGTHTLFYRLFHSSKWNWFNDLKARYAELRTKQFSEESLTNRFLDYGDLFRESGADVREQNRWNGYHTDILGDVDYIKQWIADRLKFLDKQYNYSPVVDGIQTPTTNEAFFTATGGSRCIVIETNKTCNVKIYSLGGQLVRTVSLDQPITKVEGLNAGVYIVGKQKVVVR